MPTPSPPGVTRRALLGAAALAPLAGCAKENSPDPPAGPASSRASATDTAQGRDDRGSGGREPGTERHTRLTQLEAEFGARLGVYALATGTGTTLTHRADERFAFCSTFKALAVAAVLHHNPMSHLDTVVRYTEGDLLKHAPVTSRHVATGMTVRQLCDAAVRHSDGTAGNLLLRDLGGPARLTAYLRGLGDRVSRMDRPEPALTQATPGDPRDTTSPRAFATDYHKTVLGKALPPDKRAFLRDLLQRNTTGAERIRAGVPRDWTVADKTGTGAYGTLNDIALAWPPNSAAPLVIAIMSSKPSRDARYDQSLIAGAAEYVVGTLT